MRLLALLSMVVLAGCASITSLGNTFEGAADYRLIPVDGSDGKSRPLVSSERVPLRAYSLFQAHPEEIPARNSHYFTTGDFIQISLRTGTMGWFSEGVEQRLANNLFNSTLKGEVAIIANVTEGATSPGGVDAEGNLEGRVVFYSGDVYRNQRLNEFNVPIYGPARYGGGPLTIEIWVLELDRAESDQMGAVLNTLTSLSAEIPSMSLPGVDILSQIGTAFLQSNTDDIVGRMKVTLAQPRAGQRVTDPILQISDIVMSRTSRNREDARLLDTCYYLPLTGRVVGSDDRTCGGTGAANRNNIFVLGIRKVPEGQSISSAVTLAELNQRLSRVQVGTTRVPDLNAAIDQIGDEVISAGAYSESISALERITSGSAGGVRELDAERVLRTLQCGMLVARHRGLPIVDEACGQRASERQMNLSDLARLSQRLENEACLSSNDLSFETFISAEPTAAGLIQKRQALYAQVRRRPATTPPPQACPTN